MSHGRRQRGGRLGEGTGQLPLCPAPAAPIRREKKYMHPLDPSRPLSQRKVYVKSPRNVPKHCTVNAEFFFISGR